MAKHWQLLWRGKCRCYYNAKEDYPKIWSVDDGNTENEYKVVDIHIIIPGFKTDARTEDMPEQPKVWFEHPACAVYMSDENEVKITWR